MSTEAKKKAKGIRCPVCDGPLKWRYVEKKFGYVQRGKYCDKCKQMFSTEEHLVPKRSEGKT